MPHRRPLLELLERYVERCPDDAAEASKIRALVEARADCFERSCLDPGHITASCWIVSPDRQQFLLTHHRKLDRWLQLGGHADGVTDAVQVALTEAREESGMERFTVFDDEVPLDVDVHLIPARGDEPAHEHHDVRFLLIAEPDQEIEVSEESHDVRWFEWSELERVAGEESVLRMAHRARRLLG